MDQDGSGQRPAKSQRATTLGAEAWIDPEEDKKWLVGPRKKCEEARQK
jgi:hypothetical protein